MSETMPTLAIFGDFNHGPTAKVVTQTYELMQAANIPVLFPESVNPLPKRMPKISLKDIENRVADMHHPLVRAIALADVVYLATVNGHVDNTTAYLFGSVIQPQRKAAYFSHDPVAESRYMAPAARGRIFLPKAFRDLVVSRKFTPIDDPYKDL